MSNEERIYLMNRRDLLEVLKIHHNTWYGDPDCAPALREARKKARDRAFADLSAFDMVHWKFSHSPHVQRVGAALARASLK